jgi:hypothetical protein
LLDRVCINPFGINSIELVGLDATPGVSHVLQGVCQIKDAALAKKDGIVKIFFEPLPEFQRMIVDSSTLIP